MTKPYFYVVAFFLLFGAVDKYALSDVEDDAVIMEYVK
jgi:hypothetical protein